MKKSAKKKKNNPAGAMAVYPYLSRRWRAAVPRDNLHHLRL